MVENCVKVSGLGSVNLKTNTAKGDRKSRILPVVRLKALAAGILGVKCLSIEKTAMAQLVLFLEKRAG
jgi:hypothetical protein